MLAVGSLLVFFFGVWRRFGMWRQGQSIHALGILVGNVRAIFQKITPGALRLLVDGLGQRRVLGRGAAGWSHLALFAGFMMLLLGTTLLETDRLAAMISRKLSFHHGLYYVIYEYTLDVFGLLFLAGCGYFLLRRTRPPASLGQRASDWWVLAIFIAIGVTGYLVEGLRMVWQQPQGIGARCSPVGLWVASWFSGLGESSARSAHFGVWWLHAVLVFGFFAMIPFTRLRHIVAGPLNLFFAQPGLGRMRPVTMEEVEQTERVGVSDIRHFTQQQLLSLDACMACGRCEEACPAFATGKPLSPKKVVQDLMHLMEDTLSRKPSPRALHGETIAAETLWACTACSACVQVCPVRIDQLTLILEMRRHLVSEGGLSGAAATALRRMQAAANPWGLPPAERADWRKGVHETHERTRKEVE